MLDKSKWYIRDFSLDLEDGSEPISITFYCADDKDIIYTEKLVLEKLIKFSIDESELPIRRDKDYIELDGMKVLSDTLVFEYLYIKYMKTLVDSKDNGDLNILFIRTKIDELMGEYMLDREDYRGYNIAWRFEDPEYFKLFPNQEFNKIIDIPDCLKSSKSFI